MNKIREEIWTLAGVLLVIITLSGEVRAQAILISAGALLFWLVGSALDSRKDEEESESGDPS